MTNITSVALHDAMPPITTPGVLRTAHPKKFINSLPGGITTMNAIEVVRHSNKAYNAHDAEALAATYGEDATYSNPRAGKGLTGKAIANYAKAVWAAYPDASVELITVGNTGGGLVATQWVSHGNNTGTLPDGTPASGPTVTLPGATFTRVEGGKIRSEEIYFDRQNLFEQLGLKTK